MKISTLLVSLLLLNSSVLVAQFMSWVFTYINPFVVIGIEVLLLIGYYAYSIIRDVRKVFDIEITM